LQDRSKEDEMAYAATLEVETPEKIANWRPLVHWILAIPQFLALSVLGVVGSVVAFFSWATILITGALPVGLANLQCLVLRYNVRVTTYAAFLHEQYPPFDFTPTAAEPGGTPVTIQFTPVLENRNRLTSGLRFIWVIPAAVFAGIIMFAAQVVIFIAFFAVLFTGSWPIGMREFVVAALRLSLKVNTYAGLLTDEYPPFSLTD
jgi:hypothetical protein